MGSCGPPQSPEAAPVAAVIFDLDGAIRGSALARCSSFCRRRRHLPPATTLAHHSRHLLSATIPSHPPPCHTPLSSTGTIIDTESLVLEVVRSVIESHGKTLTAEAAEAALGMRPAEAWAKVAAELGIPRTGQQLYEESEPLLRDR